MCCRKTSSNLSLELTSSLHSHRLHTEGSVIFTEVVDDISSTTSVKINHLFELLLVPLLELQPPLEVGDLFVAMARDCIVVSHEYLVVATITIVCYSNHILMLNM